MKLIVLFILGFIRGNAQDGSIYNFQITTPEGQVHSFSDFKGKKIVLVVLPVSKTSANSLTLAVLDSFSTQYQQQTVVIGIPTYEDGYSNDSLTVLTDWYKKVGGNNIILSKGMSSRKSSVNQDQLFAWITHASQNGHFDQDIEGPGEMFFINDSGQLYGAISSSVPITGKILKKMIQVH